ncbi:precorrin-3B synthase [Mycolicibacterium sp. A43C]
MGREHGQDRCPGALRAHPSAGGALVRVRLPGGFISAEQLELLANLAAGNEPRALEFTSRGALQLRRVADPAAAAERMALAGLVPSATHDRVRNIAASPLSGRHEGITDVRPWIAALDSAIQQRPQLADLPGRFWFGIDDGRGDVSALNTDIGLHAMHHDLVALTLAGRDTGIRVAASDAVAMAIEMASRFQLVRDKRWRVREMLDTSVLTAGFSTIERRGDLGTPTAAPVGWFEQRDGRIALGAAVPLGVLPVAAAYAVASLHRPLIITPWRSLVVADLEAREAVTALSVIKAAGLVLDRKSPWLRIGCCAGSPNCERSRADVRHDALQMVENAIVPASPQYLVGCERACGSTQSAEVLVADGTGGYRALAH